MGVRIFSARFISILSAFVLIAGLAFAFGLYSGFKKNAAFNTMKAVYKNTTDVLNMISGKRHYSIAIRDRDVSDLPPAELDPGLLLMVGMAEELVNTARVVTRDGEIIHEWRPDWFTLASGDLNIPADRLPQVAPGTVIHGAAIMENGDLAFNFEGLATARLDACGAPRWFLDNLGHHSLEPDGKGNIWISGENLLPDGADTGYPNMDGPLRDYTIQRIGPDGEILETHSVIEILSKNDLLGLLHMGTLDDIGTVVTGDTMHLNDVEVFPDTMPEGVFSAGDLMISLRNINTVLVIDPVTHAVKFQSTGRFLRQHDPDFVSGNEIIVYDNRNLFPEAGWGKTHSRVLSIDARSGAVDEVYKGTGQGAFFTNVMGKHQKLPGGNVLVTVTYEGRAIELTPEGDLVWQYVNRVGDGYRGILSQATLLPPEMDRAFFEGLAAACPG